NAACREREYRAAASASAPAACPLGYLEHAVRARCAASRKLRDWPHTRRESVPPVPPRSGADAERFRGDEQSAHDSQPRLPRASGTARGSATPADCVESWRTSLLPLGKVRHSFSQDVALHGHPRQLGSQAADLHLLGGHLRTAVGTLQPAFPMSLDPVEQRLLYQTQRSRCRRYTLARLNKPNRLLPELHRTLCANCVPVSGQEVSYGPEAGQSIARGQSTWLVRVPR